MIIDVHNLRIQAGQSRPQIMITKLMECAPSVRALASWALNCEAADLQGFRKVLCKSLSDGYAAQKVLVTQDYQYSVKSAGNPVPFTTAQDARPNL
jgi:hypothetical protein